jgi:mono/diheme cytochrome c family protein
MMAGRLIAAGCVATLGLVGCMTAEMPVAKEGRALYLENCAICHGESAQGNGELAVTLPQAPKDLTLIAARHGGTLPRAEILSTVDGYTRSEMHNMPEFGALLEGDLIPFDTGDGKMTPTPRKLVALVEYLESIQVSE